VAQVTAGNRLRALARNPRVLALVALAALGAVYLRRQSAGSALDATANPVTAGPLTGDPIPLDPGQSLFLPGSGQIVTAPYGPSDPGLPPDEAPAPDAPTQDPGAGGSTPAAAPANRAINVGAVVRRVVKRHTKGNAGHLGGPPLGKPGKLPPSALAVLEKMAHRRPALAHPPSHSNVVKQTTTISRAVVKTKPGPKIRKPEQKHVPKIPSSVTHSSSAALPRIATAAGPKRKAQPAPKQVVHKVLAKKVTR
jgi:hypothetical protein